MSDFDTYLNSIKHDKYGEDVRLSIQNGILELYKEGRAGIIDEESREIVDDIFETIAELNEELSRYGNAYRRTGDTVTLKNLELPFIVHSNGLGMSTNLFLPFCVKTKENASGNIVAEQTLSIEGPYDINYIVYNDNKVISEYEYMPDIERPGEDYTYVYNAIDTITIKDASYSMKNEKHFTYSLEILFGGSEPVECLIPYTIVYVKFGSLKIAIN